jgi:hypothetical protein
VASSLVAIQGSLLAAYAVLEVVNLSSSRLVMGATTAIFFLAYGAGLMWCARVVLLRRSWARSPMVFAQALWIGVAWSFRGAPTTWVAVALVASAAVAIGGLLHPSTQRWLHPEE